ncbi:hypothetical protein BDN72DRAFT_828816 [Pluteus cervinus]|uniref:Uncharacterized protein n=1 Tax=Pluteus cervinus TaxID=181527 RepID=A0ACD3A4H6_9AGAR|nr:hypothetical protein BDN72DRAFT_828816 [Pluteus cervinus]
MGSSQSQSVGRGRKRFSLSLDQILDLRELLLTRLPYEVVDMIIEEADYAARIRAKIRVKDGDGRVLRDGEVDGGDSSDEEDEGDTETHQDSGKRQAPHDWEVDGSDGDDDSVGDAEFAINHSRIIVVPAKHPLYNNTEKLLVTKSIPEKPQRVRENEGDRTPEIKRVVFRLESCDQGWGGEHCVDPYDGSYTWFEAVIYRPDVSETPDPRAEMALPGAFTGQGTRGDDKLVNSEWVIQRNKRADVEYRRHEVVWTKESNFEWDGSVGCGTGKGFVESLKFGDKIGIIARAQYPGWVNKIKHAEVEVVFSC